MKGSEANPFTVGPMPLAGLIFDSTSGRITGTPTKVAMLWESNRELVAVVHEGSGAIAITYYTLPYEGRLPAAVGEKEGAAVKFFDYVCRTINQGDSVIFAQPKYKTHSTVQSTIFATLQIQRIISVGEFHMKCCLVLLRMSQHVTYASRSVSLIPCRTHVPHSCARTQVIVSAWWGWGCGGRCRRRSSMTS
jgi:hypothetical protein